MALFALAFRPGSRVGDIAKLLATQVLSLPSSTELVMNFQLIETLRDGAAHASLLAPDETRLETEALAAMKTTRAGRRCMQRELNTGYRLPRNANLTRSHP